MAIPLDNTPPSQDKDLLQTESLFQTIFESEPECVKLIDENLLLLDMNPAGLAMIEAESIEQVAGMCVEPLIAPEHRQSFREGTSANFQGEKTKFQFQLIALKGTRRWMESSSVPLRNTDGQITAALSVTHDITKRKEAEDELRLSEERYRQLLQINVAAVTTLQEGLEKLRCTLDTCPPSDPLNQGQRLLEELLTEVRILSNHSS